jgi:hypothetical protein
MSDILDLANNIATSKENIRQAIVNKKVECDNTVPFNQYADKISQIRLASDYSDVVSLDAINYTGQSIKKGDKVWIVPNITKDQTEFNAYGAASNGYYVSRDGQKIIGYQGIVYTDTKEVLGNYNNTDNIRFVWGVDDIYGYDSAAQNLASTSYSIDNTSLLKNNGKTLSDCYIYEDIYMQNDTTNKKRQILINNKQDKINLIPGSNENFIGYAYTCFDRVHSILFCASNSSGSYFYTNAYKLDKINKTVTYKRFINVGSSNTLFACTSDGKYQFYYLNGQYASGISATSYDAANNKFSLPDYEKMNSDFPNLFERSSTYAKYNQIDDVLYILDYNNASNTKPFYGYAYKYDTNTQSFYLLNKVEFPKEAYYSTNSTYITGSADGKILVQYKRWTKSTESAYKYKAVSTLYNNSGALSGIAEENATTNQSFKVGVVLGPQTELTVTTNTDNVKLTVE